MNTIGGSPHGGSDPHFLAQGPSLYERKRQVQDRCMAITYVLFFLGTSCWGIAAIVNRNPNWADFSEDFMNNSTSCNINTYMAAVPSAPATTDSTTDSANSFASAFSKSTVVWLPISAAIGIVFSIIFVVLYRKFAEFMVYSMVILSIVMSYVFAIVALASGAVPFGILLLVMAAIVTCMYCLIWRSLKIAAKLLAVAGRGLIDNPALILSSIVTQVLGLGVLAYQFVTVYLAFSIGAPAFNVNRDNTKTTGTEGTALCYDFAGATVPCCQFNMEGWAVAFVVFEVMALYWTGMMVFSVKLYTVADTIAQWYFLPQEGAMPGSGGSVMLALKNCFTNSFGSLAFSSLILAIIRYLRNALENAARDNLCCAIINCLVQPLLRLLEQFTQFCTIGCAITGQSFVQSARTIFDTLKRNFLPTYTMWWIPEMVMGMSAVLLALAWTAIVYFATWSRWENNDAVDAVGVSFAVSAVCFVCTWFIIHFTASVLLDIVNTVYICFVLDLDNRRVTKPEIYEIFMMVPTIQGRVVENPDGNIAYGAPVQMVPTEAPPPQAYPPHGYPPQGSYPTPHGYPPQQTYPAVPPQGYPPPQRGPNYV